MKYTTSEPFIYIVKTVLLLTIALPLHAIFFQIVAAENKITPTKNSVTADKVTIVSQDPLVIKSQVKGSQEQPNVIYIMPWQGIENPISIDGDTQKIMLPHFKPINPKSFKQQARLFHKESSIQSKEQRNKGISSKYKSTKAKLSK